MTRCIAFLRNHFRAVSLWIAAALVGVTLLKLNTDFQNGGDPFRQADWLINLAAGPVRRGPFGSALLYIADTSGLSALSVVTLLQGALLVLLMVCTLRVFHRLLISPAYLILLFSPAFFPIFWAVDPQGSLRKELFAFAALGLVASVPLAPAGRRWLIGGALSLFLIGLAGHEGTIVLLPALLILLFLVARPNFRRARVRLVAGIFAALTLGLLAYGVHFNRVPEAAQVCAPLLERGFDPSFCNGAIRWLDHDIAIGVERARARIHSEAIHLFPLAYLMVSLPLLYLISLHHRPGRLGLLYLLLGLPMLPLYGFTLDWGRWMNFHVVSFGFVLAGAVLGGWTRLVKPPDTRVLTAVLLFSALFAPGHLPGVMWGGILGRVFGVN